MERRLKISPKFIIILAVVLAVLVAVCAWVNHRNTDGETDGTSLSLCVDGKQVAEYSISELMDMDEVTEHAELQSAKEDDESGDFTGVLLEDLLEESDIDAEDCKAIILSAGDGYSSAADKDETDRIIIAYSKDGDTLGYYTRGGTGPLRAIFCEDTYGNRSVKYLTKINCQRAN